MWMLGASMGVTVGSFPKLPSEPRPRPPGPPPPHPLTTAIIVVVIVVNVIVVIIIIVIIIIPDLHNGLNYWAAYWIWLYWTA